MPSRELVHRRLADAKRLFEILDGDLLLFRRRSVISLFGRGDHSHAATAAWWGDEIFCVEVREWFGGRAVTLASQVAQRRGQIDVFRANAGDRYPEYDRRAAVEMMRSFCGRGYNWAGIARLAALRIGGARWFFTADTDDTKKVSGKLFCSEARVLSDRVGGGVDPVPHLADAFVEPADLARSPFYEYRFTLV